MINNFERETQPLTESEKELLPIIIKGLSNKVGENNAVTNKYMCKRLKEAGHSKINEARMRKIIHFIRANSAIPCLIASSKGYYIETDAQKVLEYIESLQQRQSAIKVIEEALKNDLKPKQNKLF